MIIRIVRKLFSAEIMGLVLVVFALQVFAYGVTSSLRNTDSIYFFYICLIAAWIGLALEKSKLKPMQAWAGIVALGLAGIWILGARLANPLIDLIQSVVIFTSQVAPAIQSKTTIDTTAIIESSGTIIAASSALLLRFQTWLVGLDQNVSVDDVLVRNMVWLFMHWLAAAWAGWFTARRNAIAALMPALFILTLVTSYSEYKVETIWALVCLMLLLMGIWNYKNHIQQWETHKFDYSESIRYDNTQAVIFLTIAICSVAIVTPSVSWRAIRDYLRAHDHSSKSETADNLGIQEQRVIIKNAPTQTPSLPRNYLLSGGYAHSQKIVMTIRTGELPPIANPTFPVDAPRYYWRSTVYDEYMGSGWITSSAPPQKLSANTPLIPGLLSGYKPVHLNVHLEQPEDKLFWSGTLFSADVPLTVDWRLKPQSDLFTDQATLLQADIFAATTNVNAYTAESYVPNVTLTNLRTASGAYPKDIHDRYLALPSSVPDRVLNLAQEITKGKTNSYDKAKAIETYLRADYPYDLNVSAPPPDHDVADYFLFDLKRGYCDYYATTMVVLARAAGVPARFVSGYSPGTYDALSAEYIVREANAHSWAEVYFTGIGWVEFEPTSSMSEIIRTEKGEIISPTQKNDSTAARLLDRFRLEKTAYILIPIFVVFAIVLFYFTALERWWYLRMAPASAIERIYQKFYSAGRPFTGPRTRAETSREFADKLIQKLNELDEHPRFKKLLANSITNTSTLTDLFDSVLFTDKHIQNRDARTAWQIWTQLRWRLFFTRTLLYQANRIAEANRARLQEE